MYIRKPAFIDAEKWAAVLQIACRELDNCHMQLPRMGPMECSAEIRMIAGLTTMQRHIPTLAERCVMV